MKGKSEIKKITIENFDDKAQKMWYKVIIDHYFKKLKKTDQSYSKLVDKYNNNDHTIRTIISDMKIKQVKIILNSNAFRKNLLFI